MEECGICKDPIKGINKPRVAHLLIHKDNEDHVHIHGDLEKKEHCRDMLIAAEEHIGVTTHKEAFDRKEIVFHNRQRIGDALVFTCAVRDFKKAYPDIRVNVQSIAMHIWDNNPYLDRTLIPTPANTVNIGPAELTNASNRLDWHFTNAYRVSMEKTLKIHIPQGESRPDIWLTEEEYNAPRIFEKPYWIICITGEKGWGCKMWPSDRWQKFVEQNPDKNFVQIGAKEDNPPRLTGPNCIDYVGKTQDKQTGIRDLYKLFLNAEGSVGLVSFHMHLSGALYKPCVVVAGAREPVHFTRYPGHAYLSNDGMLPCAVKACWHCAIDACTNLIHRPDAANVIDRKVPKCADMIEVEDLTRAINGYYKGGRLRLNVPSEKPDRKLFKNVVPTPVKKEVVSVSDKPEAATPVAPVETYGMSFNGGAIRRDDWEFMKKIFKAGNVKTVLEFGVGLSTLLMRDAGLKVISYETSATWRDRILKIKPDCDIRLWDGKSHEDFDGLDKIHYDFALVDGPSGGQARESAVSVAASVASLVIVHDGWDVFEAQWQTQYLDGKFTGPFRNSGRCYFWDKEGKIGPMVTEKPFVSLREISQRKQGIVEGGKKDDNTIREGVLSKEHVREESRGAIQEQEASGEKASTGRVFQSKALKFVKIVSTARGWGGCARSVTTIMKMLLEAGHKVEFIPFRNSVQSSELKAMLRNELSDVIVTDNYNTLKEGCDTLLMYADDYVWEFPRHELTGEFADIGANKKIMMLNFRRGKVGEVGWTKGWDKYMFLNSTQETDLLRVLPGVKTKVLPPCTDLRPFFEAKPDYNHSLRLVRHSSQGDTKFDKVFFPSEVNAILDSRPDVTMAMLPGPSFIPQTSRFDKVPRTPDASHVAGFLGTGNLFWYSLPPGYMDMGPRVILEAMAAGLPVLADNWGGAVDRVTPECGWLCDTKDQHVEIIKHVTVEELRKKGLAARARAFLEFHPEKWIEELVQ